MQATSLASILLFCCLFTPSYGQIDTNRVFIMVEQMPEFHGGEPGMLKYLHNCRYPQIALDNEIEGSVFVGFVIGRDGSISDVTVKKGSQNILNEAALEHVRKMPVWKPGRQNGSPVKVQYIVPIKFNLEDYKERMKMQKILPLIQFNDTVAGMATDSFKHNLSNVDPADSQLVKYFKYVGDENVFISNAWTSDPHYICEYPHERLVKGEIYKFTVCFSFKSKQGVFSKVMGFNLSNGERISYVFKGNIVAVKTD